jgi:hypothetical protein
MDYLDKILQRADLRQIRAFLLHGVEDFEPEAHVSAQRLKDESQPIYARLRALYPNEDAYDEAAYDLARALAAYERTYLELGVLAGARLTRQLLG